MLRKKLIALLIFLICLPLYGNKILIPMDMEQNNHLKAYGIAYWWILKGNPADWLLNYRGGSFMMDYSEELSTECRIRGVSFEPISNANSSSIINQIASEGVNMDVVKLEKAPKIAVYAPPGAQPWDDAVRLALEYAEVEHEIIWDEDILNGKLYEYDWVHLHHEDFTGQYGKFWASFRNQPWYIQQVQLQEATANKLGYTKVSELKKDVAITLKKYIEEGGFLFAMCSATDTYDIAMAALNVDIVESMFDGDPADRAAQSKLNYENTLAFEDFRLIPNPAEYEFSNIDVGPTTLSNPEADYFTLFDFSAKYDPVPTMLTQCHTNVVKGFLGQTTAFREDLLKESIIKLAKREGTQEIKYIHGNIGRGTFTWYGGHDPEDYRHAVGDPPTDLNLHKNSPGYRLILNNILFPAAKKKKQKT